MAFAATQALAFLAAFYIRHQIVARQNSEASRKQIVVPAVKSPMQTEEPEPRRMTVYEYDMEQWASAQKSNAIQLLILGVIHYKWAVAIPLVTQLILGPMKVATSELFQAYVLGKALPRPFEVPKSPFADMLTGITGGGAPAVEEAKPKKAKSVDTKKSK